MKKFTLITAFLITANLLFAQIINIPADYPTIQEGVDAAYDGDTVIVVHGTYYENIILHKAITLASNYLITLDTTYISQTIIDGNYDGSVVTIENMEDQSLVLCGFTITHGQATISNGGGGAGIYCYNSNPRLSNLIVSENSIIDNGWGEGYGSGIWCNHHASPILSDVNILDNYIGEAWRFGAGIAITDQSNPILKNVVISGNSFGEYQYGGDYGTGLYTRNSNPILIDVLITENYHGSNVIYVENSSPAFINVTITQNASFWDDLLYIVYDSHVSLINSIVYNVNDTIRMYCTNNDTAELTISHSIILGGESGIQKTGNSCAINWLEGNIDTNPLFIGSGEYPYSLSNKSPCVNVGTPDTTGLNLPVLDLAGNQRVYGDSIDMGAYEWNLMVGIEEAELDNTNQTEVSVYPNPANHKLYIKTDKKPDVEIFTLTGERMFSEQKLDGGNGIDISHLPGGIYFIKLQVDGKVQTKKMVKM